MDVAERASDGKLSQSCCAAELKARDASVSWFWAETAGCFRTTAVSAAVCRQRQVLRDTVLAGVAEPGRFIIATLQELRYLMGSQSNERRSSVADE